MNPTKSLSEQLSVNALEIECLKELLSFTTCHAELLAAGRDSIANKVEPLVENVHALQTAADEIALIIGCAQTLGQSRICIRRRSARGRAWFPA